MVNEATDRIGIGAAVEELRRRRAQSRVEPRRSDGVGEAANDVVKADSFPSYRYGDTVALAPDLRPVSAEIARTITSDSENANTRPPLKPGDGEHVKLSKPVYADPSFTKGMTVAVRATPSKIGVITKIRMTGRVPQYDALINNKIESFYPDQLIEVDLDQSVKLDRGSDLLALLTAQCLYLPSTSSLVAAHSARVDFRAHQFRPAHLAISADKPRILDASGVGAGKTIMAGHFYKEMLPRLSNATLMICAPKTLVDTGKWQKEFRRFDVDNLVEMSRSDMRDAIAMYAAEGCWPDRYSHCVVAHSVFDKSIVDGDLSRGIPGLATLDIPPAFGVLIVDEAHHLRNDNTYLHQGISLLADEATAVSLLTATPLQMVQKDLFNILNIVRSDIVTDERTFEQMIEPNEHLIAASAAVRTAGPNWAEQALDHMGRATETYWGRRTLHQKVEYQEVIDALESLR